MQFSSTIVTAAFLVLGALAPSALAAPSPNPSLWDSIENAADSVFHEIVGVSKEVKDAAERAWDASYDGCKYTQCAVALSPHVVECVVEAEEPIGCFIGIAELITEPPSSCANCAKAAEKYAEQK
ncbi:hypothetical protein BX600DRAFT_544395 [Xylariales sp. PMI_506]|nr:hypothetical protein BX600DRAFT_544395 [Xylariales sp. PMI_506]